MKTLLKLSFAALIVYSLTSCGLFDKPTSGANNDPGTENVKTGENGGGDTTSKVKPEDTVLTKPVEKSTDKASNKE